ncbi:unnamed protein product [Ixodes pacificus]
MSLEENHKKVSKEKVLKRLKPKWSVFINRTATASSTPRPLRPTFEENVPRHPHERKLHQMPWLRHTNHQSGLLQFIKKYTSVSSIIKPMSHLRVQLSKI